jgi:hypothetical protein
MRVEINAGNADEKCCVDAMRGRAAGRGFGGYTAESRCSEEICGADEVVGVPLTAEVSGGGCSMRAVIMELYHVLGFLWKQCDGARSVSINILLYKTHL